MKPDYSKMIWKEHRAYCVANRDDLEGLRAFFDRRSPDSEAVLFHPPTTEEEWKEQQKKVKEILEEHDRRRAQEQNQS